MFYDNFVRLCNSVRKSPSAVALDIGISKPTVSRWKAGSVPNYATALRVADYFGVSVEDLTSEQKNTATEEIGSGLREEDLEIIKLFRSASPEKREAIRALLK